MTLTVSSFRQVRAYKSPQHIRKLMNYQPGMSFKIVENSSKIAKLKCQTQKFPRLTDSHRNSNFYDPVLTRIGLGK